MRALLLIPLLLTGCMAETPKLAHPLPKECLTPAPGTVAVVRFEAPGTINCGGKPAIGCTTAQVFIRIEPPRSKHDRRWTELLLHEFCHVSHGAWHP